MNKTFEELCSFVESQPDDTPINMGQYTTGAQNQNCGCVLVQFGRSLGLGEFVSCGYAGMSVATTYENLNTSEVKSVNFKGDSQKVREFIHTCERKGVRTFKGVKKILNKL